MKTRAMLVILAIPFVFAQEGETATVKALIVGIDTYQNSSIPPLKFCVKDAQAYSDILARYYQIPATEIVFLSNEKASKDNIKAEFARLSNGAGKEDLRIFVYAGHGTQAPDKNGDEEDKVDEALVPNDAVSAGKLLLDDEVEEMLRNSGPAGWILILDCCHSGTATKNLAFSQEGNAVRYVPFSVFSDAGQETGAKSILPAEGWPQSDSFAGDFRATASGTRSLDGRAIALFAACRPDQKAMEDSGQQHGKFTNHFLKGFESKALDPARSSYQDVANYLQTTFEGMDERGNSIRQTPDLEVPESLKSALFIGQSKNLTYQDGASPVISQPPAPMPTATSLIPPPSVVAPEVPIPNAPPSFRVEMNIEGSPSTLYENKPYVIWIESEEAGFLTLMNWRSDGQINRIYPKDAVEDNRIGAREKVGFRLRIGPPYGNDILMAIVTRQPFRASTFDTQAASQEANTLDRSQKAVVSAEILRATDDKGYGKGEVSFESRKGE